MSKKRNSILANFGSFAPVEPIQHGAVDQSSVPVQRVGAGVIGATQRSLSELRAERDKLQLLVNSNAGHLEIHPELIDSSPFPDRLPDDSDQDFVTFATSFEEEGQKVPIQVRAHPEAPGRYQIVYGHRRWRAAKQNGRPLKAIVVELSDAELAVSQGIENAERQDLTWIEKALFAWRMENTGIKPRDIKASLSIDDAEISKMRSVMRVLNPDLISKIGRAPKIGRPRWLELAEIIDNDAEAINETLKTLAADKVSSKSSSDRFNSVLNNLKKKSVQETAKAISLRSDNGTEVSITRKSKREMNVVFLKNGSEDFTNFIEAEIKSAVQRYFERDAE